MSDEDFFFLGEGRGEGRGVGEEVRGGRKGRGRGGRGGGGRIFFQIFFPFWIFFSAPQPTPPRR